MDALIGLGWPLSFGSSSLVFARFGVCPFLGVENLVLSLQDSRGVADALGAPLTYRLQGQNPLDVERVQLVGMRQGLEQLVQAPRQPPGIAHGIDELDALQLRGSTSARLLLSTDVSRSTVAVPCGEPSRRPRSRAHIGRKRHGKAVRPDSCRGAATREPASVPATTSSSIPAGAQQPPMGRIPCPEGLGAHAGFHAARLRPFDPNTRPGAPWTRRGARRQAASKGRDTFSGSSPHALRARTTRKTAVGRLLFPCPTSLPPLQARPRCMRLTRRKARHRGGPQSLRSKT